MSFLFNPLTGELDLPKPDPLTSYNLILGDRLIRADFTRVQRNPTIASGVTVTIEAGGEFLVL